jgi:tripartite-type tricarboxylate transporter receptor subunit TctC
MRQVLVGAVAALLLAPVAALAEWQPDRPITVLVPWAAGGITDQVVRVTAGELEALLGESVVVVNQPGASGAIATQAALEAERDGYTWTSGAPHDLGAYRVLGMLETDLDDWHLFLVAATTTIVSVNPDTPYRTLPELIEAMKARPGEISVATAGINSSGHLAVETVAQAAGVSYRHVPYDGGNPAVIATVGGETEVTTQLSPEQAEMIRAGRLRPLAVLAEVPLTIEGHGDVPPITDFLDVVPESLHIGFFLPKGVPDEVVARLEDIWSNELPHSEAIASWGADRGAILMPLHGEEARERAFPSLQTSAWVYHDAGRTVMSPDEAGIPRKE